MPAVRIIERPERVRGLRRLEDPPQRLYVRGALPGEPAVAIVGTRRADPDARVFAEALAHDLALHGVSVISGGAVGIDAAAHRGALRAAGHTLVVFAGALEAPYPRRNLRLFEEVLRAGGGWLTETPPGSRTFPGLFLRRNRLIAALCDVLVVVQAPKRSGALSSARRARNVGVPVLVAPAAPGDPRSEGGLELLATSAAAPCRSTRDVLGALGLASGGALSPPQDAPFPEALSTHAASVLDELRRGARGVDALSVAVELDVREVRVALVELAARGLVVQGEGAWRCPMRLLRSRR